MGITEIEVMDIETEIDVSTIESPGLSNSKLDEFWRHRIEAITQESIAQKFFNLSTTWKLETRFSSSTDEIISNDSYLKIISLGQDVLPLIFWDLKKEPEFWFTALKALTGADPVNKENIGNLPKMSQDWLKWAKEHEYSV